MNNFSDLSDQLFSDASVNHEVLRERAFNYRWAEQDEDVIPLTAADPDFPAPEAVRRALIEYIDGGYFSYGPPSGLPDFLETIVSSVAEQKGIVTETGLVLPIDSAARAMFVMARMVLEPGDEAILFDPVDYLFKRSVEAAGAVPVLCPVDTETGRFDPDRLEELVTARTRMIGVCNPHNPLGHVLRPEEVSMIANFADRHDLWIMNDEIWSDIVYEDPNISFRSLHSLPLESRRKTITIYGFSKGYALAGLRAAFVILPDSDTYRQFIDTAQIPSTAGGITTLSQVAATAALRDARPWANAFVRHLQGQRDYAVNRLRGIDGVKCLNPEGTFVLFPDIRAFGMSSVDIAAHILQTGRVAIVPGSENFFGPGGAGHIRICFATSRKILTEGFDRLEHSLGILSR